MRISRRAFLRAGAPAGLLAVLAACADAGVHSRASDKNTTVAEPAAPTGVGVLPSAPSAPKVSPTKFAMVGDSITKASSKSLTSVLEAQGFTDITIEAEVSRRIAVGDGRAEPLSGVKTLFTMIADGVAPDVWAFAMGTNDVGKYKKADEYAATPPCSRGSKLRRTRRRRSLAPTTFTPTRRAPSCSPTWCPRLWADYEPQRL